MNRSAIARSMLCGGACLLAAACDSLRSLPPPPSPGEQCQAWGYAPDDPECRRIFRRDPP